MVLKTHSSKGIIQYSIVLEEQVLIDKVTGGKD